MNFENAKISQNIELELNDEALENVVGGCGEQENNSWDHRHNNHNHGWGHQHDNHHNNHCNNNHGWGWRHHH